MASGQRNYVFNCLVRETQCGLARAKRVDELIATCRFSEHLRRADHLNCTCSRSASASSKPSRSSAAWPHLASHSTAFAGLDTTVPGEGPRDTGDGGGGAGVKGDTVASAMGCSCHVCVPGFRDRLRNQNP